MNDLARWCAFFTANVAWQISLLAVVVAGLAVAVWAKSADEEYDAGYAARFHDEPDCGSATANWRAGWSDADRDLAKAEEEGTPTQAPLRFFGSGSLARRCGLPFDPFSS